MRDYLNANKVSLNDLADKCAQEYQEAEPFPNICIKDFFNEEMLDKVLSEFPDLSKGNATSFNNPVERKLAGKGEDSFEEETKNLMYFLNSEPFLKFLQKITGIKETLLGDPYFSGGGHHEIKPGGYLKIHADFNRHPITNLDRRINVLVYLNKSWKEEYGGHFELWDSEMKTCKKRILPEFNTMAIFSTTDFSYHGHPDPLKCPEDKSRKSLALYYYTNGRPEIEKKVTKGKHDTLFQKRKGNSMDKVAFNNNQKFKLKSVLKECIPPIIWRAIRSRKNK
ncbi:MAG: 2OG-Fe(II) oxygenase [Flavobacteriales bacterium]|nr:2OG-Fe(II) oxygenase [Flavobacteriales bacterium]